MKKTRLEAFSDGVIAILITIMVLGLKIPKGTSWQALRPVLPQLLVYVLSFSNLGIYWNNHHHLLHAAERINGRVLWANLLLLFWLSLLPFTTGWMGENHFAPLPTAAYGAVLLLAAVSYFVLVRQLLAVPGQDPKLGQAIGKDFKGKISLLLYAAAIPLAFVETWLSDVIYVAVAMIWFVPDKRIEARFYT